MSLRPVVLASASAARRAMLAQAGVAAEVLPAAVDEAALKARLRRSGAAAAEVAAALARSKADAVLDRLAGREPVPVVVAADQVLTCDGDWFDKPAGLEDARRQLLSLRGRTHRLTSAAVVLSEGAAPWQTADSADLTMRAFGEDVMDSVLAADSGAADSGAALATVGGYRVEGPSIQLFERISGDWFTILGMPLLAVLQQLRATGALAS